MDFTSSRPRQFNHREWNAQLSQAFSGVFFWGSFAWYVRRYFLVNRSVPKLLAFAAASYYVSQDWSKVFFLPVQQEALIINNFKEESKSHPPYPVEEIDSIRTFYNILTYNV